MGSGRWDPTDWSGYTTSRDYASKTIHDITSKSLDVDLDPKGVKLRESRDSADNPLSTAVIIALDVTGSMHPVIDVVAKKGLNTLVTEIYDRKPVTDPHIMCMGIGDVAAGDVAPLQITQFEADIRIAKQLEKLWIEGHGGGNNYESYALAWYFAAHHTSIDCFLKRGIKGYLFTIGDEEPTRELTREHVARVLGDRPQADVDMDALLTMVSRQWEVFHVIVAEGNYAAGHPGAVRDAWMKLLGQRALWLEDHTKLAEVIVSAIQIHEGASTHDVVDSWDGTTAVAVRNATAGLSKRAGAGDGMVSL